jgi:ATP-dependent 26S proteasome regulatory subunit
MENFKTNISDYICSGHALLHIDTFEKDRAIAEIAEIAKTIDRKIIIWSVSQGWVDEKGAPVCKVKAEDSIEDQLKAIIDFGEGIICILQDFGVYLKYETYPNYDVTISLLNDLRKIMASVRQSIIFVGPGFEIPLSLTHDIAQIDFSLPDEKAIEERIRFICKDVSKSDGDKFKLNEAILPEIIFACKGMTSSEVADRVALSLRKHKDLNKDAIKTLVREKASVINSSGLLQYIEPRTKGLSDVGGYEVLKNHVKLDKPCFTQEAKEFGIEFPRGILEVGVPGCGKTLMSEAIAADFNLPLIAFDVGSIMGSLVGQSEANMRQAIKIIESVAPCVLQVDEIEKAFGGNNDLDGGTSKRTFSSFLKWMSDRESAVYIVATANDVSSLPVELLRSGRFDALFGFDLPNEDERQQIFDIHITKRGRSSKSFNTKKLSQKAINFVGADIEQAVKMALKIAFAQKKQLKQSHIELAIEKIVPLSKVEPEKIKAIQEWCQKHTRMANPQEKTETTRKVSLD